MERGHLKVLGITDEVKERKARRWGLREGSVAEIWGNIKSFEFFKRQQKSLLAGLLPADRAWQICICK